MIDRIKRFWKKKEELPNGVLLALEKHGHKFYVFDSILYVPTRRQKMFQIALANYGRNMTEIDQRDHALMMSGLIAAKDWDKLNQVNVVYQSLIELDATTTMTMAVASPVVLIDDEPLEETTTYHNNLKHKLCQEHEDIEDFFLSIGIAYTLHTHKQLEDIELLDYLKNPANRIRESLFLDKIGRSIYQTSKAQ